MNNTLSLPIEDAYALRRVLSGLPIPDNLEVSPMTQALLTSVTSSTETNGTLNFIQSVISANPAMERQIMSMDPKARPPVKTEPDRAEHTDVYVPALPQSAALDVSLIEASENVGRFHNDVTDWLMKKSAMTPRIFLESAAIWMCGLVIARRCMLPLPFAQIHPHLYFLWIATTTYYHKSTGLNAILSLVRETAPHLLLPESTTSELLMAKMSGQPPTNYKDLSPSERKLEDAGNRFAGQRGMGIDEASKLLIPKRYMDGHAELIMQLYDGGDRIARELRSDGKHIIYQPALSLIGATTPAMMAKYVGDTEWHSGLLARMLLLTPEHIEVPYVIAKLDPQIDVIKLSLSKRLLEIHNAFPMPLDHSTVAESSGTIALPTVNALMEANVMQRFNAYSKAMHDLTDPRRGLDDRLRGNYGRFAVTVMKIALNFAVMDWVEDDTGEDAPRILEPHWAKAQLLCERYRASAHRLLNSLNVNQDTECERKILTFLTRHSGDKPASKRDIHRDMPNADRKDLDAAIDALLESGDVIEVDRNQTGPGRKTKGYVLSM